MKVATRIFAVLFCLSIIILPSSIAASFDQQVNNAITEENHKLGTTDWQIADLTTYQSWDTNSNQPSSDLLRPQAWTDSRDIKGYASQVSINHGQSINLHVSTTQASYNIDVYRMGWYGGAGGKWVTGVQNLTGQNHGVPSPDPTTGMIEATWPIAYTLNTTTSWVSGVYLAKLTASNDEEGYILFIVRDDSSTADIVFQVAITTYQAYNNWGGKSLYDFNSDGGRAYKVSFDRPYELWAGAGYFFQGDYTMIRWLEREGYNVTYAASTDVESNPNLMNNHKVFLSNYHDEYWSMTMRDNITAARDAGKHLAFFDSNNIYWQIRYESSTGGTPNRVMVCYKDAALDPMSLSGTPELTTVRYREAPVNMPENEILGVMYHGDFGDTVNYDYVVSNASHWIYNGTGLQNNDTISEVVGDEYDNVWDNGLTPDNLVVLSSSPVAGGATSNASIYTADSGAMVFDASTNRWALKLDDTGYDEGIDADPNIQQMTRNLLNQMIGTSPTPVNVPSYIYDDGLSFEWEDNNSAAYTNYANTSPIYAGAQSIAHNPNTSSNRISIKASSPLSTSGYTHLRVVVQATQSGQQYTAQFWTESGQPASVNLANYGGSLAVGSWKVYDIPLADMGGDNTNISYLWLRPTGGTISAAYFDEIGLISTSGNTPPVAVNDSYSVNEDETLNVNAATGVLDNDTDNESDPLTATPISTATNGSVALNSDGSFSYTPNDDFNGSDSFTYQANDGTANSNTATVTITVNAVNDQPDFSHLGDQTIPSGTTTQQTVSNWAYDFDFGSANESGQNVDDFIVNISSDPDNIFTSPPDIANNGALTYTPNGTIGSATISVQLRDDGGTGNGGNNTSTAKSFTISVDNSASPVASFTLNASALVVDFTDTSTNSPTSWAWDFGDEGSSTQQNPSHTYSEAGTYQVCLTATNTSGSDQACTNLTLYEPPVASFTHTTSGLQADFTDTSTNIPTSWAWDFGDGGTSTQQNPSHTYAATGDYTICLTATNQAGSDQSCGNVSVTKPPTAAFTFDVVGMTANFSDTSTDNPTSWTWAFGDSGASNQQDVAHTYASIGTYNVCLTVSNIGGNDQTCQDVSIGSPPTANFSFATNNLNVSFTDTSTDLPTSWSWTFGDGASSTSQNPSHAYAAVGTYSVCLTATNVSGSNQICKMVTVAVGKPILVNPTGIVSSASQTFEWTEPASATWYQVYITNTSGTVLDQWYQVGGSSVTCNAGTCTFNYTLPAEGDYTWYIYGYGPFGNTQWSSPATFTLDVPAPGTINKTAPANTSTLTNTSVTFTWDHDPNATNYQLWVGNGTTPVYNQWLAATSICVGNNCSVTMTLSHGVTYTWFVHPYGPGGDGGWGSPFTFTVAIPVPAAINKTAPIGATANTTPLFTWDHDNAATWYHVWVGDSGGNAKYDKWFDATTVCSGATCSLDTALTYIGNFSWYVHGWSPGGTGPWGSPAAFSYTMSLNAPTGSVSGANLSYNWNDLGTTTSYYHLWVGTVAGTTVLDQWVNSSTYCNGTTCTFPTTTTLAAGNYRWFIQPYGTSYGNGSWSAPKTFTVATAPHPESTPLGMIESNNIIVENQGNWQTQNTTSASGNSYLISSGSEDDVLILEFYGTSIEVVYVTHPAFGSFAIDIDNNIRRTVLTIADETTFGNSAVVDYLEEGYHTLRIYPVDGVVAIDAFVIR